MMGKVDRPFRIKLRNFFNSHFLHFFRCSRKVANRNQGVVIFVNRGHFLTFFEQSDALVGSGGKKSQKMRPEGAPRRWSKNGEKHTQKDAHLDAIFCLRVPCPPMPMSENLRNGKKYEIGIRGFKNWAKR